MFGWALIKSPTMLSLKIPTPARWLSQVEAHLNEILIDHAKRLLRQEEMPLLETSIEVGLSGPSRLHDLFVTHEAMSPGEWKAKGGGLTIRYGFHTCSPGRAQSGRRGKRADPR